MERALPVRAGIILLAVAAGVGFAPGEALAQRRCRPSEVQISPPDAQIRVGQQSPFLPTAYDATGNPCADATFTWTSNNPRVAMVDNNGVASGVGTGVAIITARTGTGAAAKSGQATIQVTPAGAAPPTRAESEPPRPVAPVGGRPTGPGCAAYERQPDGVGVPEALYVNPLRLLLVRGEVRRLDYRTVRGDTTASRVCIVFEVDSAGARIASVDSFGVIIVGTDTGRAVVRVLVQGPRVPPRTVTVDVRADAVRFERNEISMSPSTTDTLSIVVPQQENRPFVAPGLFQFSSSNPGVVRVGLVRPVVEALQPGTARITAESNMYEPITVTINVHRRVVALAATPADSVVTIAIGGILPLQVSAMADDTSAVPEAPLTWTRPDSSVVRFDAADTTVRGLRVGETTMSVSAPVGRDSSVTKRWRIRVVAGGLAVSRARLGLGVGERVPLAVQLLDDQQHPIGPATDITWTSSSDSVARVQDGQVVARRLGHATLTARAPWDSTVAVEVFIVGDMLVSAQRAGRWDLFMMSDTTAVPVTGDSALESQAAWSPDLTRIAYVAAPGPRSGDFQLYVANADGSEARRITRDSAVLGSPAWVRPTGEQIVYDATRAGRAQIYIVNRDGTGARALTSGQLSNTSPNVSPDGRKIVFVSLRESSPGGRNYDIYEMNIDGTAERRLTTSPRRDGSPAYSADGRHIYFLRDEGSNTQKVYRIDTTTGAEAPVTQNDSFVRAFSVSADQATLALAIEQGSGRNSTARVMLFTIATGQMTPMPSGPDERLAGPAFRPATPR